MKARRKNVARYLLDREYGRGTAVRGHATDAFLETQGANPVINQVCTTFPAHFIAKISYISKGKSYLFYQFLARNSQSRTCRNVVEMSFSNETVARKKNTCTIL